MALPKGVFLRIAGIFALCLSGSPIFASSDSEMAQKLGDALDRIATESKVDRFVSGGLLIATGLGMGVGTYLTTTVKDSDTKTAEPVVLGVAGGILAVTGGYIMALPGDADLLPQEYDALPDSTPEELEAKVQAGKEYIAQIASGAFRARLLGGAALMLLGGAEIAWYAKGNPADTSRVALYGGIFTAALGL